MDKKQVFLYLFPPGLKKPMTVRLLGIKEPSLLRTQPITVAQKCKDHLQSPCIF